MTIALKQQLLPLQWNQDYSEKSFHVGSFNELAYKWVQVWPQQCSHILFSCIYGPKYCGKSHLLAIWQKQNNAHKIELGELSYHLIQKNKYFILPHIDQINDPMWLFTLYNDFLAHGCFLLTSAYQSAQVWESQIPDLASRFKTFYSVEIQKPNDLSVLLKKMLRDKGMVLSDFQIQYILKRVERSFKKLYQISEQIDQLKKEKDKVLFQDIIKMCEI